MQLTALLPIFNFEMQVNLFNEFFFYMENNMEYFSILKPLI